MAKPSRTQRANRKPPSPKSQEASTKAEQARQLQKIRDAAFRKGQRMAARAQARKEGYEAGLASVSGTSKAKTKHKGPC